MSNPIFNNLIGKNVLFLLDNKATISGKIICVKNDWIKISKEGSNNKECFINVSKITSFSILSSGSNLISKLKLYRCKNPVCKGMGILSTKELNRDNIPCPANKDNLDCEFCVFTTFDKIPSELAEKILDGFSSSCPVIK